MVIRGGVEEMPERDDENALYISKCYVMRAAYHHSKSAVSTKLSETDDQ